MPHIYKLPQDVLSPKNCVEVVKILFDGGINNGKHYSVAQLRWEGVDCIGIRWNINQREWDDPNKLSGKVVCVGEPNSRGYSTWFVLPEHFLRQIFCTNSQWIEELRSTVTCEEEFSHSEQRS